MQNETYHKIVRPLQEKEWNVVCPLFVSEASASYVGRYMVGLTSSTSQAEIGELSELETEVRRNCFFGE